ncbi:MAG: tRNA pseudouridine(38-40) synthase TruA [Alphaproteobacteria bacterium]|nr:tRNA pseudouridine(38-40) synthase TruA [Alphaproteobacteria bacterium]
MTVRYKLTVEYDGSAFVGWQRQNNGLSVQGVLEEAVRRLTGCDCSAVAAGRTDTGVHALAMGAHVDLIRDYDPETVRKALNFHMKPHPVAVIEASLAPQGFHARFSALERSYLYRISNRPTPPVLERHRVWWISNPLDAERMSLGAAHLIGHHDFSTFRAGDCQAKSPFKTLDGLSVERQGDEVHIRARSRSFLHRQVRNMVGTLKMVGEGKWSPQDVKTALEARARAAGGPTAPPQGLYFVKVIYPA